MARYVVKVTNLDMGVSAYSDWEPMFVDKAKTFQTNVQELRATADEVKNAVFEDRNKAYLYKCGLEEENFEEQAAYGRGPRMKFEVEEI